MLGQLVDVDEQPTTKQEENKDDKGAKRSMATG